MNKATKILKSRLPRLKQESTAQQFRVKSPLAKYDKSGNLSCAICRTPVRNSTAWKVHVNSRQHKANAEAAKKLCVDLKSQISSKENSKTPAAIVPILPILPQKSEDIPKDSTSQSEQKLSSAPNEQVLPENFFDVPSRAKDTNDAIKEEWEKFQKEIREETFSSTAIIAGDHENATVNRQIQEINEQIQLWSKIIKLEDNVRNLKQSFDGKIKKEAPNSDSEDECDANEFPDWRAKNVTQSLQN